MLKRYIFPQPQRENRDMEQYIKFFEEKVPEFMRFVHLHKEELFVLSTLP